MNRKISKIILIVAAIGVVGQSLLAQVLDNQLERIVIMSDGWELIGDLRLPTSIPPYPAVLMLNEANGERTDYEILAEHLARHGIASLSLDLRGHGESTNLGAFMPGTFQPDPLIWNAESDVISAHEYLKSDARIDESRLAFIGASYSGEEIAEAGRMIGYVAAYVLLSPGSLTEESIDAMDSSGVPWLYIVSHDEPFMGNITTSVLARSNTVEISIIPGTDHATGLLRDHPEMSSRLTGWLINNLL